MLRIFKIAIFFYATGCGSSSRPELMPVGVSSEAYQSEYESQINDLQKTNTDNESTDNIDNNPTVETPTLPQGNDFQININDIVGGKILIEPLRENLMYNQGDQLTLTAIPDDGWTFVNWNDGMTGELSSMTFKIVSDLTIGANFEQIVANLNLTVSGKGEYTLEGEKDQYHQNDIMTLKISPEMGWEFERVIINGLHRHNKSFSPLQITQLNLISNKGKNKENDNGQDNEQYNEQDNDDRYQDYSNPLEAGEYDSENLNFMMEGDVEITIVFKEIQLQTLYISDFDKYNPGKDPSGWIDTKKNNSMKVDDTLFQIQEIGVTKTFGTKSIESNIHSHLMSEEISSLSGYEYRGKMRTEDINGGIGVTVFSDYTNSDRYYRLRSLNDRDFHLTHHGADITIGNIETGVTPIANVWFHFVIYVKAEADKTVIKAKVWKDSESEPEDWQAEVEDASDSRLTSGTIGIWSHNVGIKHWDELSVREVY